MPSVAKETLINIQAPACFDARCMASPAPLLYFTCMCDKLS
jgi:hypothetical protein